MKAISSLLVALLVFLVSVAEAQTPAKRLVTGMVTTSHKFPLNKVKVTAMKSSESVYTDSVGKFMINCSEKDVLSATALGFESRKLKLGKQNTYLIDLLYKDNIANFNDAVNNGHIKSEQLREAINMNNMKRVKDYSTYNSIYELISSEIYGVRVSGTTVYNRKILLMNSNPQVLYVVQGKVVSDISFVNKSDVARIEFIDDVGSSMWGVQGANGVLKITLK